MGDSSEKDRHDREGGRQLLLLTIPAALFFGYSAIHRGDAETWLFVAVATVLSVVAAVFPVVAIRVVTGRWNELLQDPPAKSKPARRPKRGQDQAGAAEELPSDDTARAVLEARAEGTPVAVALAERSLSKTRRRVLGITLMVLGTAGFVAGIALAPSSPAWEVGGTSAFLGLVLWYRTL